MTTYNPAVLILLDGVLKNCMIVCVRVCGGKGGWRGGMYTCKKKKTRARKKIWTLHTLIHHCISLVPLTHAHTHALKKEPHRQLPHIDSPCKWSVLPHSGAISPFFMCLL